MMPVAKEISLKEVSIFLINFGRRHHVNISVNNIEFGTEVQEEMLIKDISYLELWSS